MRFARQNIGSKSTLLLLSFLLLCISGRVLAQDTTNANANPPASKTDGNGGSTDSAPTTSAADSASQSSTGLPPLTTSGASSSSDSISLPPLTTSTPSSTGTTGLPKLPTTSDNGGDSAQTTTWVAPVISVPPTANAPYMQKSNLPEGTVFIAVGAALGFIGLSVLAWRGLVAWSINRSVRRAAEMQAAAETKTLLAGGKRRRRSSHHRRHSSHHRHRHHTSSVSMKELNGAGQRQSSNPTLNKAPASQSSLFFSPTASAGVNQSTNRGSNYLPAGYYAAGSATPGGHSRHGNPSPPSSPPLPTSRGHDAPFGSRSSMAVGAGASNSTLSLNMPSHSSHGRAPSAYLEDLFSSHTPQPRSDHGYR